MMQKDFSLTGLYGTAQKIASFYTAPPPKNELRMGLQAGEKL